MKVFYPEDHNSETTNKLYSLLVPKRKFTQIASCKKAKIPSASCIFSQRHDKDK